MYIILEKPINPCDYCKDANSFDDPAKCSGPCDEALEFKDKLELLSSAIEIIPEIINEAWNNWFTVKETMIYPTFGDYLLWYLTQKLEGK